MAGRFEKADRARQKALLTNTEEAAEDAGQEAPMAAAPPTTTAKPAKALAKRNDPDYRQVTAYVRRTLYKDVQRELLETDEEFSALVNTLLAEWLSTRRGE